eukprot:UN28130
MTEKDALNLFNISEKHCVFWARISMLGMSFTMKNGCVWVSKKSKWLLRHPRLRFCIFTKYICHYWRVWPIKT